MTTSDDTPEYRAARFNEAMAGALNPRGVFLTPLRVLELQSEHRRVVKERDDLRAEVERLRARKDGAYEERNRVVAALATCFPSGVCQTNIPGWKDDWHGCVYIDLPTGQVSWHFHDSQAHLFAHLKPYKGDWDGHDTDEKYRRVATLTAPAPRQSQ